MTTRGSRYSGAVGLLLLTFGTGRRPRWRWSHMWHRVGHAVPLRDRTALKADAQEEAGSPLALILVQNFFEELKARVPN